MIANKTKHQFLYTSMRATRLAYLDLARNMFCKKWAELRGNTLIRKGKVDKRRAMIHTKVYNIFINVYRFMHSNLRCKSGCSVKELLINFYTQGSRESFARDTFSCI